MPKWHGASTRQVDRDPRSGTSPVILQKYATGGMVWRYSHRGLGRVAQAYVTFEQFDRNSMRPADEADANARPDRGGLRGELHAP